MRTEQPMVYIQWLDSKGVTQGWEDADELEPLEPVLCETVGFLIDESPEYKTLAISRGNQQVLGRMTIPTCAIKKVKWLRWRT